MLVRKGTKTDITQGYCKNIPCAHDVYKTDYIDEIVEAVNDIADGNIGEIPTKTSQLDNDSNFVSDSNYVHTDNNYTDEDKEKLNGLNNDYDELENKPKINDIELSNNKSLDALGIQEKMDTITNQELDKLFSDL